jgi:hypothetical protein
MRRMSNRTFLSWLAGAGIADGSGGGAVWLTFAASPDLQRSWDAPRDAALHGDWLRRVARVASVGVPFEFAGALGFGGDERGAMEWLVAAVAAGLVVARPRCNRVSGEAPSSFIRSFLFFRLPTPHQGRRPCPRTAVSASSIPP